MKLRLFLALCLTLYSIDSFAAVAKNDSGVNFISSVSAGTSLDLSTFTVSAGSNLCLIAMFMAGDHTGLSITWDNGGTPQTMTQQGATDSNQTIWYLVAPHTGNKTLHAAWTTTRNSQLGAIAFSGADQTTCVKTTDTLTAAATSATATITLTSTTDGATVAIAQDTSQYFTSTSSGTELYRDGIVCAFGNDASYTIGGTSNVHSAPVTSSAWNMIGVHVIAASAGGPPIGSLATTGAGK